MTVQTARPEHPCPTILDRKGQRAAGGDAGVHGICLLLDACKLLWFLSNDPKLSAAAPAASEEPA